MSWLTKEGMQCLFLAASVAGVVLIVLRWNLCPQDTELPAGGVPPIPECWPLLRPSADDGGECSAAVNVTADAVDMVMSDGNRESSDQESAKSTESSESFETIFDPTSVHAAENELSEESGMSWWITGDQ